MEEIEDIYFHAVNTKYTSSNVLSKFVISRVCSTCEISDIFETFDEIFLVLSCVKPPSNFIVGRPKVKLQCCYRKTTIF